MKTSRSDSRMLWHTRTRSQRVCPSRSNSSTASQRVCAVNTHSPRDESNSDRERSKLRSFPKIHTTGPTDAMMQHAILRTPAGCDAAKVVTSFESPPLALSTFFQSRFSVATEGSGSFGEAACSGSIRQARLWRCPCRAGCDNSPPL